MKRLLLLLLLPLLAACQTPGFLQPFTPASTPDKQHVVLFGDSLSWENQDVTIQKFAENPNWVLSHNAVPATMVGHWVDEMALIPAGSTVIVALGTNDIGNEKNDLEIWKMFQAIQVLHEAGAECIVWLTLNTETADRFPEPRRTDTYTYNDQLRSLADQGQIVVQEWQQTSLGHADWLDLPDFVHYNATGGNAYADTQVDAINRCGGN